MKSLLTKIMLLGFVFFYFSITLNGQANTIIEFDSKVETKSPQLLLLETEASGDGWSRLWFQNSIDTTSRWAFLARPAIGAQDNAGILDQPIIMAFNGQQKFGLDNDGVIRINKAFILPNVDGDEGQVLSTHGTGETDWSFVSQMSDEDADTRIVMNEGSADDINIKVDNQTIVEIKKTQVRVDEKLLARKVSAFGDPNIQIHNTTDDYGYLTFSNGGFANNRFAISADPSNTGVNDATMNFYWGNTANPSAETNFITLNASDQIIEMTQDIKALGSLDVGDFVKFEAKIAPPPCVAAGTNNGTVYFNSTAKKLRICVDGSWNNLH